MADLAVDQPRGVGAGVEDGDGAGGERDRDPGLGDGSTVTCHGAGTPYTSADNTASTR